MIITYLRSSSYGQHEMCNMAYYIEYGLGWRQPSNKAAERGTIVHKLLEVLGHIKLAEQNGVKQFQDDIVGRVRLSNYDIIKMTEKIYDYYASHSPNEWEAKDLKECHRLTNIAITYKDGAFDPRNNDIEAVEKKFDIDIQQPWAVYNYDNGLKGFLSLKGTIDQIVRINNNTLEIVDWKTGARKNWATGEQYTWDSLQKNHQLLMYYYCAKRLYPKVDSIITTIFYIKDGGPFTMCFSDADIPRIENMLQDKFEEIKNTKIPRLNRSWKCTKLCHYGKSTFEDTSILPIVEKRNGQVCKRGSCMTKCEQIRYCLEHRDMESVNKNMSAPNHNVDFYQAPGEIQEEQK